MKAEIRKQYEFTYMTIIYPQRALETYKALDRIDYFPHD